MRSSCNALERVPVRANGWPPKWLLESEDDLLTQVPIAGRDCATASLIPAPSADTEVFVSDVGHAAPDLGAAPFVVVTDAAGLETVIAALVDTAIVGLDTETTGLNPRTDRLRLLTITTDTCDGGRIVYVVDAFHVDLRPLWETLAEHPIVAHNATFDLGFLAALGFVPGVVDDTMILSQLVNGTRHARCYHGLGQVVERELGRPLDKTEQKSDWSGCLTPEQLAYAAADAAVLPDLYAALTAKVRAAGLTRAADIEGRCLPAMAWLCQSGAPLDAEGWETLAREAADEAKALSDKLGAEAPPLPGSLLLGEGWNWDSPAQVKEVFAALGVKLDKTDDDALAAVNHPLAELIRQYRSKQKLAGTYGLSWYGDALQNGRVHAGWKQIGAESGRMACASPNLQNLPRDHRYRCCFRAPAGRVLVKADYSQVELRIAAKIAGEKAMLDAYTRGEDLHTQTARKVLGIETVTKQHRQLAKALNFGLLYGMGVNGLRMYAQSQYGVALTQEEARDYRQAFFTAYPGLARWHRSITDGSLDTRTLANRRRADVTRFTEKLNSPVQGTGADGLKMALALLWERRAECPGAFPVLVVHDEIVVEADADKADGAAAWLKQAMLDGMAPLIAPVPVEVEVEVAATWGGAS
jgi:DNA polymerase I-like protein with 3'-5' exonuclease and polymerase domains